MSKIIVHNKCGRIYTLDNIPPSMFEFFIHKKREFKDGTCNWAIGVSPTADTDKGFVFETIRGTEDEAVKRFEEIIKSYEKPNIQK